MKLHFFYNKRSHKKEKKNNVREHSVRQYAQVKATCRRVPTRKTFPRTNCLFIQLFIATFGDDNFRLSFVKRMRLSNGCLFFLAKDQPSGFFINEFNFVKRVMIKFNYISTG